MGWNVHLPKAEWYRPEDLTANGCALLTPLLNELKATRDVSIDTETTGLNIVKDIPLFWSMAWGERRMCMPAATMNLFREIFADEDKRWIFANAKYDMHILNNVGFTLEGSCCDSAVMHALLYEEQPHGLKDMAREVLGWKWTDFKNTFGLSEKKEGAVAEALFRAEKENLQLLIEYAANDAYGTLKIYEKLKKELEDTNTYSLYPSEFATMGDIFFKTEMPYTKVLWGMERKGITIDRQYLKDIEGPCQARIKEVERDIVRLAGRPINPNSPLQLRDIFFNELKCRPLKYTKGGKSGTKAPSVDYDFLHYYRNEIPLAAALLEHRDLTKLDGTYIQGLQNRVDSANRIHSRFNQDVARTGRLSSSDPNLQNVPTTENDKFKVRGAFIPQDGCDLIVVDYAALEMRLLAAAAMDPLMIQIFLDGKDIHMGNAEMVFGRKVGMDYEEIKAAKKIDGKVKQGELPPEAMTDRVHMALQFRQRIKTIAFGLNYGMRENKLARDLGITKDEALALMEEYMATYPAVSQFYESAIKETEQTGYSFTIIGRRRYHPEILSNRDMERFGAQRQAVNNQIQGGAADVVRFAQLGIDAACLEERFGCRMLLQVHDELVFECPKETVEEAKPVIRQLMEHPFFTDLAVPLDVSLASGPSWMNAK